MKRIYFFEKRENVQTTYQDANANDGVYVRKIARDRIFGRIEKRHGERAYQDGHIEIRHPR